jgi:alkanesulfonate monooxygenase SsuD/methylene tetrahydromethanopterin reductase-like flavin-dependent oxidoreductase (luciferase family)
VGPWIANIYLRHPLLCAETAATVDELSGGRLILGLGVSHQPFVEGIFRVPMGDPKGYFRSYVTAVRRRLSSEDVPGTAVRPRPIRHGVPIYGAALALGMAELAGELCDGVMLYLCPKARLPRVKEAVERGKARAGRRDSLVDITTGLPAFISEDLSAARSAAKNNLAFYGVLPFYNKLFRNSGFKEEAGILSSGDRGRVADGVSDRMADELNLVGPPSRCREQLAAFREAGVELQIVVPNAVGGEAYAQAVRSAIETFGQ